MLAKKEQQFPQKPVTAKPEGAKTDDVNSLRGTFVSVMLLGGIVLVSWVGVFLLYLARN